MKNNPTRYNQKKVIDTHSKEWEQLLSEVKKIDRFYQLCPDENFHRQFAKALDTHWKMNKTAMLDKADWLKLHILIHNKIIREHELMKENHRLYLLLKELSMELSALKKRVYNYNSNYFPNIYYS